MNRWMTLLSMVLAVSLTQVATAEEPEHSEDGANLPKCPVMGEPVDFAVSTPTDQGPVYFCCKRCIKKFTAKPEKFAKDVAAQRKVLASMTKIQVTCPITGKPIDPKAFVDVGGRMIFACCKRCVGKIAADPSAVEEKLAAGYTYQTKCPVAGEEIDPTVFTTVAGGGKVYFCCPKCIGAFNKDPAKFAPKLEAQGFATLAASLVK